MSDKKVYFEAEIEIKKISMQDVITTSDEGAFGKEDWDEGGWTTSITG